MSFWRRAPRVLMMWLGVLCVLMVIVFFVGIGVSILRVYEEAGATFQPVPDMSGGISAIITAIAAAIPALLGAAQVFSQRHTERMDQQARGLPVDGTAPFPSSPDSGGGAPMVNPHGGPGAP